jgi:hypothetical protein
MTKVTLTLKEAAAAYDYTVSTLRAEAGRGRLRIFRIGRRDYTMPGDVEEMIRLCRAEDHRHACTSTKQEASGLFETERRASAQAALSLTMQELKRRRA